MAACASPSVFLVSLQATTTITATKRIQQLFKLVLVLISLSGIYGVFLHLQANFEFEQEIHPTASTWSLFSESISGAFPALAPLSLIVLALIGYAYLTLINQKK